MKKKQPKMESLFLFVEAVISYLNGSTDLMHQDLGG